MAFRNSKAFWIAYFDANRNMSVVGAPTKETLKTMRTDFSKWPYGAYLCEDSIVYFDRRYQPIVRITRPLFPAVGEQAIVVCDPAERISHSGKEWFYKDATSPRRNAQTRMRLQRLLDTVPRLHAEIERRARVKVSA